MKPYLSRMIVQVAVRIWLPIALVVAWWFASANSQAIYFPPLQTILETLRRDWLWEGARENLLPSGIRFITGFLLASVLGVAVGVWLGLSARARAATDPLIQFLRAIPPPVLIPIAILFLGITSKMNVAIIVVGAVWPTILSTSAGVRSMDPQLRNLMASYRLGPSVRLFSVILPSASPQIFAGLRTTLQLSLVLIVVSEMVEAVNGVGFYVLNAQQTFAIPETWAGTLLLGISGYLVTLLFLLFERRIMSWQAGMQRVGSRGQH